MHSKSSGTEIWRLFKRMYPACCHGSAGLNDSLGSKLYHVQGESQCSGLEGLQLPTPDLDDSVLGWEFFSTLDRYS